MEGFFVLAMRPTNKWIAGNELSRTGISLLFFTINFVDVLFGK